MHKKKYLNTEKKSYHRQIDRSIDRQIDRQIEREREKVRERQREIDRQMFVLVGQEQLKARPFLIIIGRYIDRQIDRQMAIKIDRQIQRFEYQEGNH